MKRTTQFKQLLQSSELDFLLEAHNGVSAKIGEEAGFKALWAGGLCMSAQYGVRDSNEASWTQVLEMLEFMADATSIPILLDGDTGYGNFNNVRRLVHKLEQRNIAAVCIEDKIYPKTNSFINGEKQQLAEIDEFCSRIKAGKDAQKDDDFCIITRVEAFIAGWGLREAMKRAEAYHEAGSDGILIHSALRDPSEILAFKKEWADRSPVIIVPTKYYATPTDVFREAGFSMAIWANHMLRAAIVAYQETAVALMEHQTLVAIEDKVVPVKEIFRLQGASELQEAEERYLPKTGEQAKAIVLAASRGSALGDLTADKPKAMVDIQGQPLLSHIVSAYHGAGIKSISVVRGYLAEKIDLQSISYVDNTDYADTGELVSLDKALQADADIKGNLFVSFGDVLFKRHILDQLAEPEEDFVVAVDTNWQESGNRGRAADYVSCSEPYSRQVFNHRVLLTDSNESMNEAAINGEWTGLIRVSKPALPGFRAKVAKLAAQPDMRKAKLYHLLAALAADGESIRVVYTTGHWLDIDSLEDLVAAGSFS
ncbi:MAG: phosphoenolpyruvate mutase [Chromatiales bacterium]|jgi:phosphoenolpyruvate phosphomutase|nr:phosphoenolpyruvate mutase [Chromatiales bacterium]